MQHTQTTKAFYSSLSLSLLLLGCKSNTTAVSKVEAGSQPGSSVPVAVQDAWWKQSPLPQATSINVCADPTPGHKSFLRGNSLVLHLAQGGHITVSQVLNYGAADAAPESTTFKLTFKNAGEGICSVAARPYTSRARVSFQSNDTKIVTFSLKNGSHYWEAGIDPMQTVTFSVTSQGQTEDWTLSYQKGDQLKWVHQSGGEVVGAGSATVGGYNAGGRLAPGFSEGYTYQQVQTPGIGVETTSDGLLSSKNVTVISAKE